MKQILSLWDACPQGGKHRRSVFLRLLLLVCMLATASAGWADTELVNIDFTKWTAGELIKNGTTTTSKSGETGTDMYFSAVGNNKTITIDATNGLSFDGDNANITSNIAAIKLTGINETFTITINHNYTNAKPYYKYSFDDGGTEWKTSGVSFSNTTAPSSNGGASTVTINATNSTGILYLGRYNSTWKCIKSIVITTPAASSGPVAPTSSVADNSSLEKNTANAITLTSSGNTVFYQWSQTNNEYAANAGSTLAGVADGNGSSSINVNTPSTAGTWYLYTVAYDGTSEYSDVTKYTYTITNPTAATPTFSPASGSVTIGNNITISSTDGGTVYYKWDSNSDLTTTGTTGTTVSTTGLSAGSHTLYAVVTDVTGKDNSAVGSATYTLTDPAAALTAVGTGTFFNFSNWATNSNITSTAQYATDGTSGTPKTIEFVATPSNKVEIRENESQTISDESFTKRFYPGAAGSSDSRYIHFKVNGPCKILVYARSGNSSRELKICTGSFSGNDLLGGNGSCTNYSKLEAIYNGTGEEDIYIYGTGGNVSVYGIKVEPAVATTYAITKGSESNGTFSINKTSAAAGESVTVTTTPATGYEVGSVTTTPSTTVATTTLNTTYTFTMPASDVTVDVNFTQQAAPALAISTQPVGASYNQGATATALTVVASNGTIPYEFQWYRNTSSSTSSGTAIPGATNESYTPSTGAEAIGTTYYYCKVTDAASATVTSTAVAITVKGAAENEPSSPATTTYASKTFLDVSGTKANGELSDGSKDFLTYGARNIGYTVKPSWYSGTNSKWDSGVTGNITGSGFLPFGGSSSYDNYTSTYGGLKLNATSSTFYVTGTTGVAIYASGANSTNPYTKIDLTVEEVNSDGTTTAVGTTASTPTNNTLTIVEHGSVLDATKYYKVTATADNAKECHLVQIRFTKSSATPVDTYNVTCASGLGNGSISSNVSKAAAGATVTITGNPSEGYRLNTVTVTENGGSTTTPVSGTGNSRTFTMPAYAVDVTATFVALPTITTSATNGTVTTSPASYAAEGTTVTITATPASGYALDAITVTDGDDNPVTVTSNQFTMPSTNVTITATFVASQTGAGDKWNFTRMNSTDDGLYESDNTNWSSTTSSGRTIYSNKFTTSSKETYATYSTTSIEQIEGITFRRVSGGGVNAGVYQIFKPSSVSATDGYLQLNASNLSLTLPNQTATTKLTIYYSGGDTKGFTVTNAKTSDNKTQLLGEDTSAEVFVTENGPVEIKTESSGFKIYKIVVGDVVDVDEPTITNPADGTEYDGTTALSPTVTTTQAADGGTVTTYWAYSTAAMTRAQIIAANHPFTTTSTTATITATDVNERTMVLSAVTQYVKGGNTYFSEVVTATYPYTGVRSSNLTVDHLDIQWGEERTLKPIFKYNDGTEFDPSGDDIHSSINDYFDFTFTKTTSASPYISVDANGVVKTKDASGNKAAVGTTETFSITATQKEGWNDATTADGPWPFDQTSYSTTATITVIQKTSGFHMTFYWDPEYKQQVDPSEYSLGTGDESSVTIFSEKMYNGRMIYAKPDEGYTIYVAAGINSGSVSNVSSNSKKDGVNYYKYTYNDPTDEYPDAPIEFNGMPILIEDTEWGSSDTEKFFYLNVHTYNNSTKTFEGSPIKAKFTVLKDNSRRPSVTSSAISLKPETNADPLSTAQTVAVVGAEGAYVYGKFSSSSTYSTPNLINEKGVLGGVSSVAVFSTEVAGRKISATQVKQYSDGEYYIGGQVNLTYTYRFATELNLSSNSYYTNVTPSTKEMSEAATINLNDFIQSITYYNKDEKKDIEITSTVSNKAVTGVDEDLEKTQKETVTYEVAYRNGADGTGETDATRTTVDNNGIVTIGKHSGQVIITMTYPGGTYEKKVNGRTGVTATTSETFTIYLTDPSEQIPNITPTTRNFTDEQAVRVQAPTTWDVLYMIEPSTGTDGNGKPTFANPAFDSSDTSSRNCTLLKAGEFVMLTITETSKVRAFAFNPKNTAETSKEVYETYTKLAALQAPVLSPSGNPHVRTTKDLTVNVTLKDAISGLEVYYTTDGTDPTPTTGELFNGSEKIKVSGASTTVKAIAYDPATGRISPITTGIYVYTGNINKPGFSVSKDNQSTWSEPHYEGTVSVGPNDRVKIVPPIGSEGSTLYYTLDGSTPTPGASREFDVNDTSAPFLIMKNTTGRALAILDDASSPVTTVEFVLESDLENLWEAVEETTPGGKMANTDRYVVYGKSTGNSSTKAVKYLTATFGGMDNTGWGHADISESTKGTPLDGVGSYSIRNVIDAWDESGKEPQNSSSLLHERTFKLPAQGDMVRFEPERDGQLTIWLLQQGGLNYTDDGEFCDAFMRLRPVYLFDEQGNSIRVSDNRGIKSSTRLSSNWDELQGVGKWTEKGEKQLGVTNIYYTTEESNKIYAMYNNYLDGKGAGDAIEPFVVPDGDVKTMLSNLGLTGYGYVMPSGGYVRYNFDVQGGKTYYLFGFRTKLGVRGFRFQPSDGQDVETLSNNVTMADNKDDALDAFSSAGTNICNVTYNRPFTSGTWAALVLPFSVSRTQLQKVFGDGVDVLHLEKTTEHSMDLKRHWYPMIVAGTPVLIKPSKTISAAVFEGVHKEATAVTDVVPSEGAYMMTGSFGQGNLVKGDYYVANDGSIKYLTSESASSKSCRSWFTPKPGQSARASLMMGATDAFAEEVWNVAGNPQPFVASDETVVTYINGVQEDGIISNIFDGPTGIYTINGQLIRKDATSLEGLSKGIYIVNGKKVAVK